MKSRNHQSKHVQRLLVIVDVIQQLLAKKFIATNGNYILADTYNGLLGNKDPKTVDSKTIRENANHLPMCQVCAKGAVRTLLVVCPMAALNVMCRNSLSFSGMTC